MKRIFYLLLGLCLIQACQKEVVYHNPLSLNAVRNELTANGGSTPIIVFANDPWVAYLPSDCKWARLEKSEGSGLGEFIFKYDENYGAARKVIVTVTTGDHTSYIEMAQKSGIGDASIKFPYNSVSVAAASGQATIPYETNIPSDETPAIIASATLASGAPVTWIEDLTLYSDRVAFKLLANDTQESRSAVISLNYVDDFGTETVRKVTINQTADNPSLQFDSSVKDVMFTSMGTTVKLPFTTNLSLFVPQLLANAKSSKEWTHIELSDNMVPEIVVTIDPNDAGARVGRISTEYVDAEGNVNAFEYLLVQKAFAKPISFEDVKAVIPGEAGTLAFPEEGLLEAVVISDCTNPNIETNPNTKVNVIDFTMNWRTVYLTSRDGTSGIRAVFDNQLDNVLRRGDVIFLDVAGLTLTKEANPARYTFSGLKSSSYSMSEEKAEPVIREKTLAELCDDDVYTAVKLKGLEFTFKHGAYTNSHDGYQRQLLVKYGYPNSLGEDINKAGSGEGYHFSDCTPCSLIDRQGNGIYALINNETPWRRYGNGVPQGECDITCIITHTDLVRWAYRGYLGRYQMRILEESDIEKTGDAFTKVAIEWNWGEDAALLPRADAVKPTTAAPSAFYSITSNMDSVTGAAFNRTTTDNMCDYNNVINTNPSDGTNNKGYVRNGSVHWYINNYFWASDNPDDLSAAPWFCFAFSTDGLSGTSMLFNWTAAQGAGWSGGSDRFAPTVWKVEYSLDGEEFTAVDATYAIHPIVRYNTECDGFAINGLHMYSTPLPADLLGHDKVYVRIKAAGNNAIKSDGTDAYSGKVAKGSNMIRFGEVAVLYN